MSLKLLAAKTRIARALESAQRPAIMCSFGKDSLVVLDLAVSMGVRDIMYIENIDEVVDEAYNASIVASYGLTLHPLPKGRGLLFFVRDTAQFLCFPFLSQTKMLMVPMRVTPWTGTGDFLCLDAELRAEHGTTVPYDFDLLLFGQKRVDLLDGGGACLPWFPMFSAETQARYHARMTPQAPTWACGDMTACSPLWDWSQADVWEYIEAHGLPVSSKVYDGRQRRLLDGAACYRCHDPRLPGKVKCPKLNGAPITNMGAFTHAGADHLARLGIMTAEEAQELDADA